MHGFMRTTGDETTKVRQEHMPPLQRCIRIASGIWNMYSVEAEIMFTPQEREEAGKLCLIPELQKSDPELEKLINTIAEESKDPENLPKVLGGLLSKTQELPQHSHFLMMLFVILKNVIHPHHGEYEPSEADSLFLWGQVFYFGMPDNTPFTFRLGEQGSVATSLSKSSLSKVFDTGTGPRKCDCIFAVSGVEVGNAEAKKAGVHDHEVDIQLRKNIKIGKSMLLMLENYQLSSPPLLSIHGKTATVFSISRWNKIFIAGKAGPVLMLPESELGWRIFLNSKAQAVYNLVTYYHKYSKDAAYKIAAHAFESKTKTATRHSSEKETETFEWLNLVMHSPTKSKLGKELADISKPDGKRFRRLMQEAMAKMQKDEDEDHDETKAIDDLDDNANDKTIDDDGGEDEDDDQQLLKRGETASLDIITKRRLKRPRCQTM
ncbi:hypothetical protein EMPS_08447 [Entomortierella parvispora]|uniref:Uncharacterized protein n=1 Tax=Entomortierella parvispora TaxID=205924 RepID=A0A9P3LZE5_9FUNG|nr:hypothetical protein EMPS_08447 [Entomortierella parvispora]